MAAAAAGAADLLPGTYRDYAIRIARDWNVRHSGADYLDRFEVHQVGGRTLEFWIPAEGLDEFNRNIVGEIRLVARFSTDEGSRLRAQRFTRGHQRRPTAQ